MTSMRVPPTFYGSRPYIPMQRDLQAMFITAQLIQSIGPELLFLSVLLSQQPFSSNRLFENCLFASKPFIVYSKPSSPLQRRTQSAAFENFFFPKSQFKSTPSSTPFSSQTKTGHHESPRSEFRQSKPAPESDEAPPPPPLTEPPKADDKTLKYMQKYIPNASNRDAYSLLGLTSDADENSIKKAYKKAALRFHPDKNKDPEAQEAFKILGEAMQFLRQRLGFS